MLGRNGALNLDMLTLIRGSFYLVRKLDWYFALLFSASFLWIAIQLELRKYRILLFCLALVILIPYIIVASFFVFHLILAFLLNGGLP